MYYVVRAIYHFKFLNFVGVYFIDYFFKMSVEHLKNEYSSFVG